MSVMPPVIKLTAPAPVMPIPIWHICKDHGGGNAVGLKLRSYDYAGDACCYKLPLQSPSRQITQE